MTPMLMADEIMQSFNASAERLHWRASIGGVRTAPTVCFTSRGSMARVIYSLQTGKWSLTYSKANCAFGDFLASAHRSMMQIMLGLKAAGLSFIAPLDDECQVRIAYDPATKEAEISLAHHGDDWLDADPLSFKVT